MQAWQCPITCGLPTKMAEASFRRMCATKREEEKNTYCRKECRGKNTPQGLEFIALPAAPQGENMGSTTTTGTCGICHRKEIKLRTVGGRKVCSTCGVAAGFVRHHPDLVRTLMHEMHGDGPRGVLSYIESTASTPSTPCERCADKEVVLAAANKQLEALCGILKPLGKEPLAAVAERVVKRVAELDRLYNEAQEEGIALQRQLNAATGKAPRTGMAGHIEATCTMVCDFLLEKNAAYGNSAAEPVRIFSKADPLEQIRVRIDDKLSRLMRGGSYQGDNDVLDLLGYLVLMIAVQAYQEEQKREAKAA